MLDPGIAWKIRNMGLETSLSLLLGRLVKRELLNFFEQPLWLKMSNLFLIILHITPEGCQTTSDSEYHYVYSSIEQALN